MIPSGGFLTTVPPTGKAPVYAIPPVTLAYKERFQDFIPAEQDPPFEITTIKFGSFNGIISAGGTANQFGVRVEHIRNGVYGTMLIDMMLFRLFDFEILVEHCPDTTIDVSESSYGISFAAETSTSVVVMEDA